MTSSTASDESTAPDYVVCPSCGAKATPSWSFCRSCQSSLDDALSPDEAGNGLQTEEMPDLGPSGCPKCGHEQAEVDEIATTGASLSRLFDIQNRRFRVVTCQNCGYTEFYRGSDGDVIVDLFFG